MASWEISVRSTSAGSGLITCALLIFLGFSICGCGSDDNAPPPGAELEELIRTNQLAEAERRCRNLVRNFDSSLLHRGNLARVLCLRGDAALRASGFFNSDVKKADMAQDTALYREAMGYFREAEREARKALLLGKKEDADQRAKVRATLGLALYRQGSREKLKQGVEELKLAIREDEKLAGAHNTLGLIYFDQGKHEAAMAEFLAALSLDPGLAEASFNLAVYYEGRLVDLAAEEMKAAGKGGKPEDLKVLRERKAEACRSALKHYRRFLIDTRRGSGGENAKEEEGGVRQEVEGRIKALKSMLPEKEGRLK